MNSRERVLRAFHIKDGKPDRPPIQFDLCRSLIDQFAKSLDIPASYARSYYEVLNERISSNRIRTALGSDCVIVGGTIKQGFVPEPGPDGTTVNEFGMHMKPMYPFAEPVVYPLADAATTKDIETYDFPDPYAPGRFIDAQHDIAEFRDTHFIIGECEMSLFELAWRFCGMQAYMLAFAKEEAWVSILNDRVESWTLGIALQLAGLGVDAIWFGGDLGTLTSSLISPDMWRHEFKPRYARMIRTIREQYPGILFIFHSEGPVSSMMEDLIEIGVSVYNPVQPHVPGSDPESLQSQYGQRISFFGGIDQKHLLPSGNIPALEEEIRRLYGILGKDGNYLMAPSQIIQADTPPEMVRAMVEAIRNLC